MLLRARVMIAAAMACAFAPASAHAAEREAGFASEFVRLCVKGEGMLAQTASAEKWSAAGADAFPRRSSWLGMKAEVKTWKLPSGAILQSTHAASADGKRTGGTCALAGFDLDPAKLRAALLADGSVKDATPADMAGMNLFAAPNGPINLSHSKAAAKFPGRASIDVLALSLPR